MSSSTACYAMLTSVSPDRYTAGAASLATGANIWLVKLSDHSSLLSSASAILEEQEQARAEKYRKEADRNRFITGRILLRQLLGEILQCPPKEVPIVISKHRRPVIADGSLHFSLSHSGDYVAVGISRDEVGVDIEHIDPSFDYKNVMQYSFDESEISFVKNSGDRASFNFYLLWTRKEALLKATGKGLTSKLSQINALDGKQEVLQEVIDSANDYAVSSLLIDDSYCLSICRPAKNSEIKYYFYS